jgi:hypothetical protein
MLNESRDRRRPISSNVPHRHQKELKLTQRRNGAGKDLFSSQRALRRDAFRSACRIGPFARDATDARQALFEQRKTLPDS